MPQTVTYQATVASTLLTQTANVQFVAGPADAAHTTITALPMSVPADGASTSTITVQAKDAHDNNLTSSGGVVTLSTDHGSLSAVTNLNNGTYTATLTASNAIETATITGTIGGNSITDQATVDFTGVPSKYLVTSSSYTPTAGGSVTITAQLADQGNTPTGVAGKTITWSKTGAGGSFGSPTSTTNASGVATVTFTTGTVSGTNYAVTATDDTIAHTPDRHELSDRYRRRIRQPVGFHGRSFADERHRRRLNDVNDHGHALGRSLEPRLR